MKQNPNSKMLKCKIETPPNFKRKNPNSKSLRCKILTLPNFRGIICNLPNKLLWLDGIQSNEVTSAAPDHPNSYRIKY